jgi:lipopolysaccharide heptosyltransferase I
MRIVLVRLSALGDIVHTWPLAVAIRAARPDAHLTWVVEKPLVPLVDGHPAVDSVIEVITKQWRRRPFSVRTRAEVAMLKTRFDELAPDLCIDAQGTLKSALVTRWTRAERRVGLARPWRRELIAGLPLTETLPGHSDHPHVVATNLALVRAIGATPPAVPTWPDGRWLIADGVEVAEGPAVLLPGAGQPDKILAPEILAVIANHLAANDHDVVVAWGPGERDRAEAIVALGEPRVRLAPPTTIIELAKLLGSASIVVGGDTGPVHLAASLGVPTVGIHLTTDPLRNGPLGDRCAVVSAAAPGGGPRGSATTGAARPIRGEEIIAAVDAMLGSQG